MNLALFIDGRLGLKIFDFLVGIPDVEIRYIFLNTEAKRGIEYLDDIQRLVLNKCPGAEIHVWGDIQKRIYEIKTSLWKIDFGVSVFFGHIIPKELINCIPGGILNLHPSMLPIGRGANPVSWNIIEERPQGITLHLIDTQLDTGAVIFQKEIETSINMSAGTIYEIALQELFFAFKEYFQPWVSGALEAKGQRDDNVTEHKAREFDSICKIEHSERATFEEFIRKLQAATLSNGRMPIFKDIEGNEWSVSLKLHRVPGTSQ